MLRSTWRGLETWHGRDGVTLADERARQQGTQTSTYTGAPDPDPTCSALLRGGAIDRALALNNNIAFLREIAIGLVIVLFLIFEPDGLAHRWRQVKAYWKLYPFSH